jgi:non-homologous end joining protein Ku
MVPPESTAQAEETSDPLLPTTLRYPEEKNFRSRVIKNLPKVKRQPYAGGAMRSQSLLENMESTVNTLQTLDQFETKVVELFDDMLKVRLESFESQLNKLQVIEE